MAAKGGVSSSLGSDTQPAGDQDRKGGGAQAREPFACGWSCNDVYSANAATAVLCRKHPNCMADFVKLFEDHYAGFVHLSEVRCARAAAKAEQLRWCRERGGSLLWTCLARRMRGVGREY